MDNSVKKKIGIVVFGSTLIMVLAACRNEERVSPDATYRAYYAKVIEGRTFDQEVNYHAQVRRQEVLKGLQTRTKNSSQTVEEIETLYLNFTQQLAKCGSLALTEEKSEGDTAHLIYAVTDTCTENQGTELIVEMVYEKGWKILSDELKITLN